MKAKNKGIKILWQSNGIYPHHALLKEKGRVCLANFGWFFLTEPGGEILGYYDEEKAEGIKRAEGILIQKKRRETLYSQVLMWIQGYHGHF